MPRRGSRAEDLASAVEKRIADEELAPGTRIGSRRDLAEWLDVAPSTVSEAIKLLEDRGRVSTKPGRGGGLFVAEPGFTLRLARSMMRVSGSGAEVADALEVRDTLEADVIVKAAEAAHPAAQLAAMHSAMEALQAASTTEAFYMRNLEFHAEIAQLCANQILRTIYTGLLDVVRSHSPRLILLAGEDDRSVRARRTQVHQNITSAIADGDSVAASSAAREHAEHGHAIVTVPGRWSQGSNVGC